MIPPKHLLGKKASQAPQNGVSMKRSHLQLGKDVQEQWGEEVSNVFLACYPESGYLLLAPVSQSFFPKIHKDSHQHILKARNLTGQVSLALHEYLIDLDMNGEDRVLRTEYQPNTKILKVFL